jgi:uncharacterized protein YbbK (DUF523 family)
MNIVRYVLIISYLLSSFLLPAQGLDTIGFDNYCSDFLVQERCTLSPTLQLDQQFLLNSLAFRKENSLFFNLEHYAGQRQAWAREFADIYDQGKNQDWQDRLHSAMHFIRHDIAGNEQLNDRVLRDKEYARSQEVLLVREIIISVYPANEDMLNLYDLSLLALMQGVDMICSKCSYPQGFLNIDVDKKTGICSACKYLEQHPELSDMFALKNVFDNKIKEAKKIRQRQAQTMKRRYDYDDNGIFQIDRDIDPKIKYDCVVGFSGGKDSVYVAYRLLQDYGLKVLLVFDDIEASSELARKNIDTVVQNMRRKFGEKRVGFIRVGFAPGLIGKVRSDFMRAGQSFCRACLRSHWGMVYREAINAGAPLFIFGFSRLQHLTDIVGIKLAEDTINLAQTPFDEIDREELAIKYHQRAVIHNQNVGYEDTAAQRVLYDIISDIYFKVPSYLVPPMIIPYFLFVQSPSTDEIKQVIARDLGWTIPSDSMGDLDHTNCRFEELGEVIYRSVAGCSTKMRELGVAVREGEMSLREALNRQVKEINSISIDQKKLTEALSFWGGISEQQVLADNPKIAWYFEQPYVRDKNSSALVFDAGFIEKLSISQLREYAQLHSGLYDYSDIIIYLDRKKVSVSGCSEDEYISRLKGSLRSGMGISSENIRFITYETEDDLQLHNEIDWYSKAMIFIDEEAGLFDRFMAKMKSRENRRIITGKDPLDYFICAKILKDVSHVFDQNDKRGLRLTDEAIQAMGNLVLKKQGDFPLQLVLSGCFEPGSEHKYKGGDNSSRIISAIIKPHNVSFVCPETLSGMKIPRSKIGISAEDGRTYTLDDDPPVDVTDNIISGMKKAQESVRSVRPDAAILKSGSPTCSADEIFVYRKENGIYDSDKNKRQLIKKDAVFARYLRKSGVLIITEKDLDFIDKIEQLLQAKGLFDASFLSQIHSRQAEMINMSI